MINILELQAELEEIKNRIEKELCVRIDWTLTLEDQTEPALEVTYCTDNLEGLRPEVERGIWEETGIKTEVYFEKEII